MRNEHLSGFLQNVAKLRYARTGRSSSWDQSGKSQDYWVIPPGEEVVLAELIGPGCITHFWMTQFCRRLIGPGLIDPVPGSYVAPVFEIHNALGVNWEEPDPFYYRKVILKIFWDEQEQPSVLAPLGDFFLCRALDSGQLFVPAHYCFLQARGTSSLWRERGPELLFSNAVPEEGKDCARKPE